MKSQLEKALKSKTTLVALGGRLVNVVRLEDALAIAEGHFVASFLSAWAPCGGYRWVHIETNVRIYEDHRSLGKYSLIGDCIPTSRKTYKTLAKAAAAAERFIKGVE